MSSSRVRLHDFYPLFVELRAAPTELPFELGGATQMGQLGDHHNNQDALALLSGRSHLVAVVSDGCASAGVRHSHNEVGAKFQAMLLADMVDAFLSEGGVQQLIPEIPLLEERLLEDLRRIISALNAHPKAPGEVALSQSFFTATLLAAVIDAERYVVFGCGDGVLWINENCIDLEEQEGRYLSERLVPVAESPAEALKPAHDCRTATSSEGNGSPPLEESAEGDASSATDKEPPASKPLMRVLYEGATADLHRLFLGTDGFLDVFQNYPALLDRFNPPHSQQHEAKLGYNESLVTEFRRKFWYDEEVEAWALNHGAHDDRTFALIRRAPKAIPGGESCST